ncbi:hypothetical protein, partial [Chromobacterium amazonense]|uniref:hypothetical protein n=1 Tax=Chromobacterium amazonense TaxID=1382803 RepID=UPI003F799E2F
CHHYLDIVLSIMELIIGNPGGALSIEQAIMEVEIMRENIIKRLDQSIANQETCDVNNFRELNHGRILLG